VDRYGINVKTPAGDELFDTRHNINLKVN
jgi:hypothetical protein